MICLSVIAAKVIAQAYVGKYILSLAWPLKTRLVKAKLRKPGQKSNSRWANYKSPTFACTMFATAQYYNFTSTLITCKFLSPIFFNECGAKGSDHNAALGTGKFEIFLESTMTFPFAS